MLDLPKDCAEIPNKNFIVTSSEVLDLITAFLQTPILQEYVPEEAKTEEESSNDEEKLSL